MAWHGRDSDFAEIAGSLGTVARRSSYHDVLGARLLGCCHEPRLRSSVHVPRRLMLLCPHVGSALWTGELAQDNTFLQRI
jgi:hypothetical protein